jgi:hypothetical protein
MPLNVTGRNVALDGLDESVSGGIKFVGVGNLTDPGTAATYAGTEATGGSPAYARKAVAWDAGASELKANNGAITLDVPAGSYAYFLYFNAVTGNLSGNYLGYAPINGTVKGVGTVDSTGVTNDTVTSSGHGLTTDDRVQLFNVFGETIPAGLTEGTLYYVLASGLTADVFKVSATSGGAAINFTGQGEVMFQKVIPEVFASQGQITIASGALVLDATAF